MTRTQTRRRAALVVGTATVVGLGLAPATAGHAAPSRPAHRVVSFGAKLTTHSQPANFTSSNCAGTGTCTRLMTAAYHRPAAFAAPKTGTINRIKIVAIRPGTFRLQVAKAKGSGDATKAKVVRSSRVLSYHGQTGAADNGPPYTTESIKVNLPVAKGALLAVKAKKLSFAYCSGGSGIEEFQPPLVLGASYRQATGQEDCFLLLEAFYK